MLKLEYIEMMNNQIWEILGFLCLLKISLDSVIFSPLPSFY